MSADSVQRHITGSCSQRRPVCICIHARRPSKCLFADACAFCVEVSPCWCAYAVMLRAAHMCDSRADRPASRGAQSTTGEERWRNESRAVNVAQRAANNQPEDINRTGMDSEREREEGRGR